MLKLDDRTYSPAKERDLSALSFKRFPTEECDPRRVSRFGIDPNLNAPGEPHYLYPEVQAEAGAVGRLRRAFRRALGVDSGGDGVTIGNAVITFSITGTAQAGALAWDQAWYFSQIGDQPVNNTFAIAVVAPASTAFSDSQIADFLSFQPFCITNMNLVNASANALVSGMQMQPVRLTPFGTSASSTIYNLQYQTTVDFQKDRGQIPFSEIVDGYTYIRVNSPIQAAAATYSVSFLLGLRPDRRSQVPKLPPHVVNSSGASR